MLILLPDHPDLKGNEVLLVAVPVPKNLLNPGLPHRPSPAEVCGYVGEAARIAATKATRERVGSSVLEGKLRIPASPWNGEVLAS